MVIRTINAMRQKNADAVMLEAEASTFTLLPGRLVVGVMSCLGKQVTNKAALNLYENLCFIREKRLDRYYLNGVDAYV